MDWSPYAVGGAAARPDSFTGLKPEFASSVYQMVQDAHAQGVPLQITSAYRSPDVQARIVADNMSKYGLGSDVGAWQRDVASMGPEAAGRKWRERMRGAGLTRYVAMPGGSQHQRGTAIDFAVNGSLIRDANSPAAQWIAQNASNYGLSVPMSWEPWQVEMAGARGKKPAPQGGTQMARQPQGLLSGPFVSTRGPAPQQPQEKLPFFRRPNVGNFFDTLAIGLQGMTLNPNQALMQAAQSRIEGRREAAQTAQQRNRTADWLESQGMTAAAEGVRSGAITGAQAIQLSRGQTQDPYSKIGKLQADLAAGRISQEQYEVALQSMAPSQRSIEVGPDGQLRIVEGPGAQSQKPFTEGQSKDLVYATRAEGALKVLDPVADELVSAASRAANIDPTGFIRSRMQSPEFQVAQQAGNEFLQAILRKDTGAAITAPEQALYGETYLPQPGDSPEVLIEKKAARQRAIDAIRKGMSPSQLIALERDVSQEQSGGTPQVGDVVDGYEFEGGDPADKNNWRKVQ